MLLLADYLHCSSPAYWSWTTLIHWCPISYLGLSDVIHYVLNGMKVYVLLSSYLFFLSPPSPPALFITLCHLNLCHFPYTIHYSGSTNQTLTTYDSKALVLSTVKYHEGFLGQRIGNASCMAFHPHQVRCSHKGLGFFFSSVIYLSTWEFRSFKGSVKQNLSPLFFSHYDRALKLFEHTLWQFFILSARFQEDTVLFCGEG